MLLGSILRRLLPARPITEDEAREAIRSCGLSPDDIAWTVRDDGMFAFGRKSPDADPIPEEQFGRLLQWARKRRIRFAVIGWETRSG